MKVITRAHSNISPENGTNGRERNGKSTGAMSAPSLTRRVPLRVAEVETSGAHRRMACASQRLTETLAPPMADRFGAELGQPMRHEFFPVAAGRSEAATGLPARATSANGIIFLFCIRGRGWCETEGKRYELMPDHLLMMPVNSERTYGAYGERSWSLIWIQLAVINMEASAAKLNPAPQTTTLGPSQKTEMFAFFQQVLRTLETPSEEQLLQVSQKAMQFLDASNSSHPDRQTETDAAGKIGRTIEYMKEHLDQPLRAATLAAVANMSLPHYFAQFKRIVRSSPIDYLIKLRMEHARRLLSETSWSVKEVAVSLGYDDPLYFSRVFKSINQTAPTDFRAKKRSLSHG